MLQIKNEPTHFLNNAPSWIFLIFTSQSNLVMHSHVDLFYIRTVTIKSFSRNSFFKAITLFHKNNSSNTTSIQILILSNKPSVYLTVKTPFHFSMSVNKCQIKSDSILKEKNRFSRKSLSFEELSTQLPGKLENLQTKLQDLIKTSKVEFHEKKFQKSCIIYMWVVNATGHC